jgi:signal transduction histidine kinase
MHFKVSTGILSRLGEELIPYPDQGIMELVKNSYDADATECTVELIDTDTVGGTLKVSDDGVGMDPQAISDGWLVIGRSKKATNQLTKGGRLAVGDKGLGRLAALRQGSHVTLKTRPRSEPGVEYIVNIDWEDFSKVGVVEDVSITPEKHQTDASQGTDTIIKGLSFKLGKREVQRLARELLLLADPFNDKSGFRTRLIAPGFSELEKRVKEAYFQDADYKLLASLDESGLAEARLIDWKGNEVAHANHKNLARKDTPYEGVTAKLEVWIFVLQEQTFTLRERTVKKREIQDWLSTVGNIHFYHRGLRVRPYGDPGNDWLEINLARVKDHVLRPSTDTVIGRMIVEDLNNMLVQKTDRFGFVEDDFFSSIKEFGIDALNWVKNVRLKEAQKKREKTKKEISQVVKEAKEEVEHTIAELEIPQASRSQVLKVIQNYEKVKERETQSLREDVLLYRSLATAGTTAAVFAHESGKPVTLIERATRRIENQGRKYLADKYDKALASPVKKLYKATSSLRGFAKFPLYLLKRSKRKSTTLYVHDVIKDVIDLFQPFLEEYNASIETSLVNANPSIRGSVALLEAILVNLMTNALNAFNLKDAPCQNRQIMIQTELATSHLEIRFMDNSIGIKSLELDEIWLPGRTTTPGGTGLGLTIVKDSVTDLGGKIWAVENGNLGGAEFLISLPLVLR